MLRGPPATPRTPARRGRRAKAGRELNQRSLADGYFSAHSEKVLTSDHTLARLHTPRLCDTEVTKLLRGARPQYEAEVRELLADHRVQVFHTRNKNLLRTSLQSAVSQMEVASTAGILYRLLRARQQEKSPAHFPRGISTGGGELKVNKYLKWLAYPYQFF